MNLKKLNKTLFMCTMTASYIFLCSFCGVVSAYAADKISIEQSESIVEVEHSGTGTGTFCVTGEVYYEHDVQIKIMQSGALGEGFFSISEDAGATWSEPVKIPLSGYYQYDYLILEFIVPENSSNPVFKAGDIYSFYIQNPDTKIVINHTGNGTAEPEVISRVSELTAFDVLEKSGAHVIIEILKTGNLDTAVWRVSQDNGVTWTDELYTMQELLITSEEEPKLCFTIRFTVDSKEKEAFQKGDVYEIYAERIEDNTDIIGFLVLFIVIACVGTGGCMGYRFLKMQIPSETEYHMKEEI